MNPSISFRKSWGGYRRKTRQALATRGRWALAKGLPPSWNNSWRATPRARWFDGRRSREGGSTADGSQRPVRDEGGSGGDAPATAPVAVPRQEEKTLAGRHRCYHCKGKVRQGESYKACDWRGTEHHIFTSTPTRTLKASRRASNDRKQDREGNEATGVHPVPHFGNRRWRGRRRTPQLGRVASQPKSSAGTPLPSQPVRLWLPAARRLGLPRTSTPYWGSL